MVAESKYNVMHENRQVEAVITTEVYKAEIQLLVKPHRFLEDLRLFRDSLVHCSRDFSFEYITRQLHGNGSYVIKVGYISNILISMNSIYGICSNLRFRSQ